MNDKPPFFSVIIPTYNRVEKLSWAIDSVLEQSFQDFEVIVVDDGSTDGTKRMVDQIRDERVKYIFQDNRERGAARNTGVNLAKGTFITFVDSDDKIYPHALQTAYDVIEKQHPEIFHFAYDIINVDGKVLKSINYVKDANRELVMGNPLGCIGIFVQRKIMLEYPFNEDRLLSGLEDWELWLRIGSRYRILSCDNHTAAMLQHDQRSVMEANVDRQIEKMNFFLMCIKKDKGILKGYGNDLKKTAASVKTYTALHLALVGAARSTVWHYLKEGISDNLMEIFRKRSLVIIKLMIFR